jgi:hypothetical protein
MAVQWDIEFIESNVMRMTYQPRNGIGVKGILMEYDHPIPSDTIPAQWNMSHFNSSMTFPATSIDCHWVMGQNMEYR